MKVILSALVLAAAVAAAPAVCASQSAGDAPRDPKDTPAYAVLVIRKAEVEAELEVLSSMFTGTHPDVRSKRFELDALGFELEEMRATELSRVPKLSETYGRLVVRKAAVGAGLNELPRGFTPGHPEVSKKRAELLALGRELEDLLR
ncbi:MAG TPA: hypothetical protein VF508_02495 [Pyrinomonadaceae bacterium]|jgi:uncharacterized protein involved in exopolysaccharide biosynthesis